MCITVLGRLLPVVPWQKMPVIYIVTARKNSALPLVTRVQKGLGFVQRWIFLSGSKCSRMVFSLAEYVFIFGRNIHLCAKRNPKTVFLRDLHFQPLTNIINTDTMSKNIQIHNKKTFVQCFMSSGSAWRYSDVQQCSVGATAQAVNSGVWHSCMLLLGWGREEMCLSSDWHSGNRHS